MDVAINASLTTTGITQFPRMSRHVNQTGMHAEMPSTTTNTATSLLTWEKKEAAGVTVRVAWRGIT